MLDISLHYIFDISSSSQDCSIIYFLATCIARFSGWLLVHFIEFEQALKQTSYNERVESDAQKDARLTRALIPPESFHKLLEMAGQV